MQEKGIEYSFFYRINICLSESRYLIHRIFNQLQQKKRGADFLMPKNTQKKILRPKSKNLFLQCEQKLITTYALFKYVSYNTTFTFFSQV